MDAFYASVEQRDYPELRGKPVVVGGSPNSRGVVCTASYEARKFGVRSAIPCSMAYRLCPDAIFVRPEFAKYKAVSAQIHALFRDVTPLIEPLSLDEAYLDVTDCDNAATQIANDLRAKILTETQLTASAGVSFNKFLAKVASDLNKPNGIAVIRPERAQAFIDALPIERFHGIGKASAKKLHALDIHTGKDLRLMPRQHLTLKLGKSGGFYHDLANGIDNRPVNPTRTRKSVGSETTFEKDINRKTELKHAVFEQAEIAWNALIRRDLFAKTLTLKVKFNDFQQITRSQSFRNPIPAFSDCLPWLTQLIEHEFPDETIRPVRLAGVTFSSLDNEPSKQLTLPL